MTKSAGTKHLTKGQIMCRAIGDKGPSRDIKEKLVANKSKLMSSEGQTSYIFKSLVLRLIKEVTACTHF